MPVEQLLGVLQQKQRVNSRKRSRRGDWLILCTRAERLSQKRPRNVAGHVRRTRTLTALSTRNLQIRSSYCVVGLVIPLLQQGQKKRRNKFFFVRYIHLIGHRPCPTTSGLTFLLQLVARGLSKIKLFWDTCLLHIDYCIL